jgi:hypothetical protein
VSRTTFVFRSAYTANYDTWNDNMGFTGKYYSVELTESNGCGTNFGLAGCPTHFTVDGSGPLLGTKVNLPGGGSSSNLIGGGGIGSWDSNYSNAPFSPAYATPLPARATRPTIQISRLDREL